VSYPLVELKNISEFINGFAFKPEHWGENGKPIIRIQNLTNTSKPFNRTTIEVDKKYFVKSGDILVSWSATLDVFEWQNEDALLNQHIFKVVPDYKIIDKKYFKYALKEAILSMLKFTRGSTMKHINRGDFLATKIPLPPLETQKQIAQVLETADQLRKDCQQVEQELNALAQSVFLEMFGDPVTNPKGWEIKRLKEISRIQIGPFGTQLHKEDYIENGIPLINPTHIKNGKIIPNSKLTIPLTKHEELPQYHLEVGDIIMGRRGEMGRCAVITEREESWLCGTGSLFIRPHNSGIFSDYLCKLLSGKAIKSHLEAESQGATMLNLNKTIIGSINIPVPSENALKMFSKAQEILANNIDLSKSSSYELLFNSLLQKAFKGELNLKSTEQA